MRDLVRQGSAHPGVIAAAHRVVRYVPERDDRATMQALLTNVRRRMRYTHDPLDVELVKAPWVSLAGSETSAEPMDCDDASVMLASMLGAVGIPSQFVVVPTNAAKPGGWSHVYVKARAEDGSWVPLDPIVRKYPAGREVPDSDLTGPRAAFPAGMSGPTPSPASVAPMALIALAASVFFLKRSN